MIKIEQNETNLNHLLKYINPVLNAGDFVFCTFENAPTVDMDGIIMWVREKEGYTIVIEKSKAESLGLSFSYIASWITLTVNS